MVRELEGKPSFEVFCRSIERSFAVAGLVCRCCAEVFGDPCPTCAHAQGFHLCEFVDPPSSSEASDDAPAPAAADDGLAQQRAPLPRLSNAVPLREPGGGGRWRCC